LVVASFAVIATAYAEAADNESVAKAQQEYSEAMKGNDIGLQNEKKIQLSLQLSKARFKADNMKESRNNPSRKEYEANSR
jgi:hypothetical protein